MTIPPDRPSDTAVSELLELSMIVTSYKPAPRARYITATEAGLSVCGSADEAMRTTVVPPSEAAPDLVEALRAQHVLTSSPSLPGIVSAVVDTFAARNLVVPRSNRWREAVSTALVGGWSTALWRDGHLPNNAVGALKAEVRTLHRQLAPIWERRTRRGRVLSLDADLGEGLSLYDLCRVDVDLLPHTTGVVFEDERLNIVLRALAPAERQVVFAYAHGEGTTWAEAAAAAGATDPQVFGERVRRKAKRRAAEHRRRTALERSLPRQQG